MKRIAAVGLAMLLGIALGCNAFAAIDLTVFENAEGVKYTYDDMDDSYTMESETELVDLFVDLSGGLYVDVKGSDAVCAMRLIMIAVNPTGKQIGFNGAIIKTDLKKYSFDISDAVDMSSSSAGLETGVLALGPTGIQMLKDVLDSTEDVKVRYTGKSKDIDFVMSDAQKSVINEILTLYTESGALDQEILTSLETLYPVTVK
jgi:hypothetical protein